jgi:hypothetical protein
MSDYLLNDEFKSDKYEVSVNELLFTKRYKPSASSVESLLSNNGYYGRVEIESITDKKFGTDVLVKVHIFLFDSVFTYTWPYQTFFNLDKKVFGNTRKLPRGILNDRNIFITCCKNIAGMFTPKNRLEGIPTFSDLNSLLAMEEISKRQAGLDLWPEIICRHHESWNLVNYYQKLIPFLCRVGLMSNNRFKIKSKQDAEEVCMNLFDVNYWYNI